MRRAAAAARSYPAPLSRGEAQLRSRAARDAALAAALDRIDAMIRRAMRIPGRSCARRQHLDRPS
jgi:hypothetical protein